MSKIAIANFSGNVGKTTIGRHLLAPRMNNAEIYAVETINSDGSDNEAIRGKDFMDTLIKMNMVDDAIVDIGSSNIESVIQIMKVNPGSHEDFDFFAIPVVPSMKQQRDTISTIEALATLGVPAKKIVVVFNQVDLGDKVETVFSGLFDYHAAEKKFTLRPNAVIHNNPLFPKLAASGAKISDILADTTDCKAKISEAKDPAEKLQYSQLLALKRGAAGINEELDAVYKALFK